jgi:hypothetical protein
MDSTENIYDKLKEILGGMPSQVAVMQEQTNSGMLEEYLDVSATIPEHEEDVNLIMAKKTELYDPGIPVSDKKKFLARLAKTGTVESYRIIEDFVNHPVKELKGWAKLALYENKMLLESDLLQESHVLISTGLGAKGMKIRYFTVLQSRKKHEFSRFQKKLIRNELQLMLKKNQGEYESTRFSRELCRITSLIPMQVPVQNIFDDLVKICNVYGDFIDPEYLITNVKKLSGKEIRKITRGIEE